MFKRILIAYDGSKPANKAFHTALDLAEKYQATLQVLALVRPPDLVADFETVLSAVNPWEYAESIEMETMLKRAQERYLQQFVLLRERAAQSAVVPEFQVSVGHPAEEIVGQAEEKSIDLIIVGHRGMGLFEHWLLGSVAKAVIAHATCAVLVVR